MTDLLTDEAVAFVRRNRGRPFFLYLPYSAPHSPFQAREDWVAPHRERGLNRIVATTYAMIERMDAGIGRVLETLEEEGLSDNTIVAFHERQRAGLLQPALHAGGGRAHL